MTEQDKVVAYVHSWLDERNFGFASRLLSDGTVEKFFVHRANVILGELEKGSWVRFIPLSNPKGLIGKDIEVFANREEMARYDAARALADAAQKGGTATTLKAGA